MKNEKEKVYTKIERKKEYIMKIIPKTIEYIKKEKNKKENWYIKNERKKNL